LKETMAELAASFEVRQREKQASRAADARALASGLKSRDQLRRENGVVRISRIDWKHIRAPK